MRMREAAEKQRKCSAVWKLLEAVGPSPNFWTFDRPVPASFEKISWILKIYRHRGAHYNAGRRRIKKEVP